MDFVIGGVAAMGATIFSNPLDVLKTRKQLQGELKPRGQHQVHYRHAVQSTYLIVKNEGVLALQKGLVAALMTQGVRNSIKLGLYQILSNEGFICDADNRTIFYKSFLASAFGGATGAFCASPLFVVTTQMQAQAADKIAVGYQHHHAGVRHAVKTIYTKHGIRGLWRGAFANTMRTLVGASAQLTTYSKTKDVFRGYEAFQYSTLVTAFFASIFSGVVQTVFQTPFDVVCSRLNNQYVDENGRGLLYKGMKDCFVKTVKFEGVRGLYKGVGVNYTRVARHTSMCLVFWEIMKEFQAKYSKKDKERSCVPVIPTN